MSFFLWFTLISTPAILNFADMKIALKEYLYFNELMWALDIIRKLFFPNVQGQDTYTSAVKYMKSTLIIDILALLPQLLDINNNKYILMKNFRIY